MMQPQSLNASVAQVGNRRPLGDVPLTLTIMIHVDFVSVIEK